MKELLGGKARSFLWCIEKMVDESKVELVVVKKQKRWKQNRNFMEMFTE